MIVGHVRKFLYGSIEFLICVVIMQINQFIFQGIIVALHGCIVIGVSGFAHALCDSCFFTEFHKIPRRILASLVTMQNQGITDGRLGFQCFSHSSYGEIRCDILIRDAFVGSSLFDMKTNDFLFEFWFVTLWHDISPFLFEIIISYKPLALQLYYITTTFTTEHWHARHTEKWISGSRYPFLTTL